jgi:hypothetical protein
MLLRFGACKSFHILQWDTGLALRQIAVVLKAIFRPAYVRWALFDSDGEVECPFSLLTAFPRPAVFQGYSAGAFLERFESPHFFAWSSDNAFGVRRHELVVYLLYYSRVTNFC